VREVCEELFAMLPAVQEKLQPLIGMWSMLTNALAMHTAALDAAGLQVDRICAGLHESTSDLCRKLAETVASPTTEGAEQQVALMKRTKLSCLFAGKFATLTVAVCTARHAAAPVGAEASMLEQLAEVLALLAGVMVRLQDAPAAQAAQTLASRGAIAEAIDKALVRVLGPVADVPGDELAAAESVIMAERFLALLDPQREPSGGTSPAVADVARSGRFLVLLQAVHGYAGAIRNGGGRDGRAQAADGQHATILDWIVTRITRDDAVCASLSPPSTARHDATLGERLVAACGALCASWAQHDACAAQTALVGRLVLHPHPLCREVGLCVVALVARDPGEHAQCAMLRLLVELACWLRDRGRHQQASELVGLYATLTATLADERIPEPGSSACLVVKVP
jgi:hypothetical protein